MIEIGESKGATILDKIQTNCAGNIGKCSVSIVSVENISFVPAPCAVGANQFVDGVPSLFVVGRKSGLFRRVSNDLPPEETVQIFARRPCDHAVRDIKVGEAVVIKIPGIARPRPAAHANASERGSALERASRGDATRSSGSGIAK